MALEMRDETRDKRRLCHMLSKVQLHRKATLCYLGRIVKSFTLGIDILIICYTKKAGAARFNCLHACFEGRRTDDTRLFFDMIDRRYHKEGRFNIVLTSDKSPSQWRSNFDEDDAMPYALEQIFTMHQYSIFPPLQPFY